MSHLGHLDGVEIMGMGRDGTPKFFFTPKIIYFNKFIHQLKYSNLEGPTFFFQGTVFANSSDPEVLHSYL